MMRSAVRFAPDYDAHILSIKAEFSQGEIFSDGEILAVATAVQKFRQGPPLVTLPGTQDDAIVLVALPIDVPIHQAHLLFGLETRAIEKDVPKSLETPRTGLCIEQTLLNCLALRVMSLEGIPPGGPIRGGGEKICGALERILRLAISARRRE